MEAGGGAGGAGPGMKAEMVEFSDKPSVLVMADRQAAMARACRSAELAGCRVSGVESIGNGVARLARQAGVDGVLVEVEEDCGDALDQLLQALDEAAGGSGLGSVVSAPFSLIDLVAARAPHNRIIHLCGADEAERIAAVASASARPKHRLHDVGKDQGSTKLLELSEEVGRIANVLATLSTSKTKVPEPGSEEASEVGIEPSFVRSILRARRLRDQYLGHDLFADPAWDILLDLFAARLEQSSVAVSSLCIAAAVPPTTALRWIKLLTDLGLLVRAADPHDGRRVYIELSPQTAAALAAYLKAAQRISPLLV